MEDKYLCQHYIDQVEDQNNNHDLNSFFLNDDIFLKKHYYTYKHFDLHLFSSHHWFQLKYILEHFKNEQPDLPISESKYIAVHKLDYEHIYKHRNRANDSHKINNRNRHGVCLGFFNEYYCEAFYNHNLRSLHVNKLANNNSHNQDTSLNYFNNNTHNLFILFILYILYILYDLYNLYNPDNFDNLSDNNNSRSDINDFYHHIHNINNYGSH
ncbi:hypothetical protein SLS57_009966 [Botryosphaeria dothidea]